MQIDHCISDFVIIGDGDMITIGVGNSRNEKTEYSNCVGHVRIHTLAHEKRTVNAWFPFKIDK